ncbi:MAG: AEC family transporter [Alphaproteobacteria bacterium]|nr:MAG: AEC family transporter [Alphaproteobacteria bacterium]
MADVLNLTIPMFSLIGIGYMLRRIQFMSEQDGTVLSKFAFYILLPPLMFTSILSGDASRSLNINFIFSYEIITISIFVLTYLLGVLIKLKTMEKAIFGLNAAYPNYGYIGVPLCILAFGAEAAIPLALILLADTFVLLTTLIFYKLTETRKTSLRELSKEIIQRFIYNPLMMSVFVAFIFSTVDIKIVTAIDRTLSIVAASATAVALIALGVSLNVTSIKNQKSVLFFITVIKLIVHPILIFIVFQFQTNIDPIWVKTAIVCASLPVAANVFVLANYYKNFESESAAAITITTIVSSITVTITLLLAL